MYKKTGVVLMAIVVMLSCQKPQRELTKKEIQAKVDSILNTRRGELNSAAAEDLDRRQSIEVKGKADSIVDAYIKTHPAVPTTEE